MKKKNKALEKVALRFATLMIQRMQEIDADWSKPWIPVRRKNFIPQNITGRQYSGGNILMLLLILIEVDYRTPVFLTFKQAKERELLIKKGSRSFPVYHFTNIYIHEGTKEKISQAEYFELSDIEQQDYHRIPIFNYFDVFNLDQTDFNEKYPEEWAEMMDKYQEKVELNTNELFSFPLLDNVIESQKWVCPIDIKLSNKAYYSPGEDRITLPLKTQFTTGQEYYSVMLHEMSHSTGTINRLNRLGSITLKDSPQYAKEELIAELSSALMSYYLGFESHIREDHIAYLNNWTSKLEQTPEFLMTILGDIVKVTGFTFDKIGFEPICEPNVKIPKKVKIEIEEEDLVVVD